MKRTARLKTLGKLNTPEGGLRGICDVLNQEKDTERGRDLVKLINEWIAASSLQEMQHNNPALFLDVLHSNNRPFLDTSEKKKYGVWRAIPALPIEGDHHSFTVWMLSYLFANPLNEKLMGPCARCGNYFIKKRATQNVYCSRRCGNAATAVARNRERIEEERNDKLLRAKAALHEWRSATTQEDWKHWIAKRTKIDPRFLTRAVNQGDLVPPKKGK
jgi:hypothetical protein